MSGWAEFRTSVASRLASLLQKKLTQNEIEASDSMMLFSGDDKVCKHFKFGFCKFGDKCHKQQTEDYSLKTCNNREQDAPNQRRPG